MAPRRARSGSNQWTGDQRNASLNGMFGAMRDQARQELGSAVSIGTEAEANLVGLPFPALCLRYLFQSTVLPLSRIYQITGEEGSAKSAFLYEVMRWHAVFGGGSILAENENKDSPELRQSILQWNEAWMARLLVKQTYSLEEWQDVLTTFVEIAKKQQDAVGGAGRTVPLCFAVDSLMATAPQSEIDAVNKDGHASRGFALAANLIARYMRTMPERIQQYPFTMFGTNHLKPATTPTGLPTANIPGGKSVKFMETYEIEMKKAMNADIDLNTHGGLRLKFIARKNSLGPSRKSITAELLWWNSDAEDGVWRQRTAWDWNTATINLLMSFETAKGKRTIYNLLKDITGIEIASRTAGTAYSTVLGIPKSAPQEYRIVATELEKRPDLLTQLYKVLGIAERRAFQPGMDYQQMLREASSEASASTAERYANMAELPVVANADDMEIEVEGEDDPSDE